MLLLFPNFYHKVGNLIVLLQKVIIRFCQFFAFKRYFFLLLSFLRLILLFLLHHGVRKKIQQGIDTNKRNHQVHNHFLKEQH